MLNILQKCAGDVRFFEGSSGLATSILGPALLEAKTSSVLP